MSPQNKKMIAPLIFVCLLAALAFVMSTMGGSLPGEKAPSQPPPGVLQPTMSEADKAWPAILAHAASEPRGADKSPFTIVEFGDFQCPQCGKLRPTLEELISRSNGQINLYFVHRPFPTIHKFALAAAQASMEAAAEGKFWPMYDELFSHQDDLEPGNYSDYATAVKANPDKVTAASQSGQFADQAQSLMTFCDSIHVLETPTLIVHDNRANKVVSVASGRDDINKLFQAPPWATKTAAATTNGQESANP